MRANSQLYCAGIPKTATKDSLEETFKKNFDGVTEVTIYEDVKNGKANRGFW